MRLTANKAAVALVAMLLLVTGTHAFFDKLGGGGGGGGCGGGGGGGSSGEAAAAAAEPADPAVNVVFLFSGKSHSGKTFIAKRFHALLGAHTAWNLTSHSYSLRNYPVIKFAESKSLDAAKLLSDWDMYDQHYEALSEFVTKYKSQNPMWEHDALDYIFAEIKEKAATKPMTRASFIIDDLQYRFQLRYFQQTVANKLVPGLELVPVRVEASSETRTRRGYKARATEPSSETDFDDVPSHVWTHTFSNDGKDDVDSVVNVDTFLAAKLLREAAK